MPIPKPGDVCKSATDQYSIAKELNRGAFATAFRARSQRRGGDVFLKRYTSPKVSVSWFKSFVAHQTELKRRITSTPSLKQNCYEFIEFFEGDDKHFYQVFEFVDGGKPLTALIAAVSDGTGGVSWEQRVRFARVMMLAIASLHLTKIVHTDLKPDNLLLLPNPHKKGDFLLRIIDLDWSIFSDRRAPWHGHIGYVGTPGYQSPEHLKAQIPTEASDVFTCGIMLSELLGGGHPFVGHASYEEAAEAGRFALFLAAQPIDRVPDMAALEQLVNRCLDPDPARRPSAAQVKDGLRGLPIPAAPKAARRPDARVVRPPPKPASPSTPAAAVTLMLGDRRVLAANIDTKVGRSLLKPYSDEAKYASEPQFRLYREAGRWMVSHVRTATNQTLVDGTTLETPRALANGMRIAVGNPAKGIEKMSLVVKLA